MDPAGALTGSPAQKTLIGAVSSFVSSRSGGARSARLPNGVCVALSGGPDSLALTFAAVRAGLDVEALIVDHGLQDGSAGVAATAAETARTLGARARVLTVRVGTEGGPEAAARTARYAALDAARDGRPVLLAHTLDDQAETVLLGLGRGSGGRSLSGMAAWNEPWGRPFLTVRRSDTVAVCDELGLQPWHDPHNDDRRFTRVRVRREAMPVLEDVLGPGVAEALARTADRLRADSDALDDLARVLLDQAAYRDGSAVVGLDAEILGAAPAALRTRALRHWVLGVADETGARTLAQLDALVTDWRGQGPVAVGGDERSRLVVVRRDGRLILDEAPRRAR
ncbi:MAG: tRNA lysidine(34) synthetase TilS [Gordonia sp. (in: high G+C Gram-positive bacteria)]|uniref:tRNA lysidine(34) synthetase TilS n=1 Tax=Gordonia sp. (in: high G+C Gram-positive bacteria) TaxID=84139 RepID=UPI0039E58607